MKKEARKETASLREKRHKANVFIVAFVSLLSQRSGLSSRLSFFNTLSRKALVVSMDCQSKCISRLRLSHRLEYNEWLLWSMF